MLFQYNRKHYCYLQRTKQKQLFCKVKFHKTETSKTFLAFSKPLLDGIATKKYSTKIHTKKTKGKKRNKTKEYLIRKVYIPVGDVRETGITQAISTELSGGKLAPANKLPNYRVNKEPTTAIAGVAAVPVAATPMFHVNLIPTVRPHHRLQPPSAD